VSQPLLAFLGHCLDLCLYRSVFGGSNEIMSANHSEKIAGASHGSIKTYMWGFLLSIILTLIPFILVMQGEASHDVILIGILLAAVVQILVHLVCFLHMNTSSDGSWNIIAFIFTIFVVFVVIGGSVWVMINLNTNMLM
jgi:cytochrome o ubiquinol oxidase subunit IV